jgi:hypothetical protein
LEERRNAYKVLAGKTEGRRPPERPRHIWKHNIEMDLKEVGWGHRMNRSGSG